MITPVHSIDLGYMPNIAGSVASAQNKGQINASPANTVNASSASESNFSRFGKSNNNQASETPTELAAKANSEVASSEEETEQQKLEQIQQVVDQLKARDREVKAHEQAHLSAAGGYATGMSFSYQTGPDGQRYAVGGEVGIDTSAIPNDPQATIQKAMVIQRAAMAPAEPSSQDYKVAQQASQMMTQARTELNRQDAEELDAVNGNSESVSSRSENAEGDTSANQITANPNNANSQGTIESSDRQQFNLRMQMPIAASLVEA